MYQCSDKDLDFLIDTWDKKLEETLEDHAPVKTLKIRYKERQPWFDDTLVNSRRELRRMERIWKKYKDQIFWNNYKLKRSMYQRELKVSKINYYQVLITKNKGNTKELYKIVNVLSGNKKENPLPPGFNDKDQAEEFAKVFTKKLNY